MSKETVDVKFEFNFSEEQVNQIESLYKDLRETLSMLIKSVLFLRPWVEISELYRKYKSLKQDKKNLAYHDYERFETGMLKALKEAGIECTPRKNS